MREILTAARQYGVMLAGKAGRMIVEFVSANPTGPLHVGHGRQAALGDAICNLFTSQGWDVYREVCDHLASTGHVIEYGPGRHGQGNNIFVYVRDPSSGLRFELFTDMEHIHDETHYEAPHWELSDRPRTMNRWGPAPADSFLYE